MLRELITWVLNTYLGKYLEDFNPAQLSVALLSGEVELENVPLRKDALRGLGLPVQALSGSIGKIKLQIPVRQFRTAPWRIIIEQIYVIVGPKNLNDWDDEKEKQSDLDYKLSQLDAAEAKWRAHIETSAENVYSSSYSSWMSYGTGLATNILENLQLKINDVHIRYEDEITIPNYKFACGITIESLTAQTCDMNWIPSSTSSWNQDISYKLVELKSFSIYWDRLTRDKTCSDLSMPDLIAMLQKISADKQSNRFIINPISAQARVKRDRSLVPLRTRSRPRLSCEVSVSQINLSLSNFQFTQMVECLHGLQSVNKLQMYRILRPSSQVTGNIKGWWQYAAKCHGFVYETYEEKWIKAKENIKYIKLYAKLLGNPNENLTPEDKIFKSQIETSRDLYELRILREVCFLQLVPSDMNLKSGSADAQGKSMLYRWFPQWWGWYGSSTPSPGNELIPIDEAGVNSIEDDILNALEDSVENNSLLKRDAVFGKFDFSLGSGQIFILTENYLTSELKTMIEMHFDNLNLNIETRPRSSSHLVGLSLGSVCVKDLITPNTEFPELIKPQQKEEQPQTFGWFPNFRSKKDSTAQALTSDNEPWFQLQYEKKPLTYNTDYRLAIKTKSLDVVYNMAVLKWFIDFFAEPLQNVNARQKIEEMKLSTKMKLIRNWRSILEGDAGQQRKIWSLDIDISAPQIIFFESLTNKNTSLVLVDFGRFQLRKNDTKDRVRVRRSSKSVDSASTTDKSSVADKNEAKLTEIEESDEEDAFMTPCSTPPGSEKSLSDSPTMMSAAPDFADIVINKDTGLENAFYDKIYDKYTIDLTDLQVLVCKNKDRWAFASTKGSSAMHVLDRFSISLELERRVVHTTDPEYPTLKLYGSLPKLMAHVNEHKIQAVSNIVDIFREDPDSVLSPDLKSPLPTLGKSPSFQFLDEVDNNIYEESIEETGSPQTNLIVLQFVVDHLTLEVQSRGRSITELQVTGVKAGLSKKSIETNISLSVHGLLLVDAIQSYGPDFELLVASHRHVGMDSVSGSLKQSEPCSPQSPGSPDPNQDRRPTSPQTISKAINSLQRANSASWFNLRDLDALITVEINLINADCDAEKVQIANINFNNLDIIANQETIVELIGFLKRVFPKSSSNPTAAAPATPQKPNLQRQYTEQTSHSNPITSIRTEITFDFHRLNVLVLRAIKRDNHFVGRKVGTFTMSEAKISATLGSEISVEGSLGGLQVLDLTPEGINHQRILSVGKDPLTDPPDLRKDLFISLTQEVYGSHKDKIVEQRQALHFQVTKNISATVNVKVRMASVWYTHCARLVQELSWCATEFKQYLKRFARSIRDKAADMAIGLVQSSGDAMENFVGTPAEDKRNFFSTPRKFQTKLSSSPNIKIDVILDTPVLVLPRNSNSSQVLVAHLGQITINNEEKITRTHHQSFDDHEIFTIDEDDFIESDRPDIAPETFKKSSIYSIDVRNMNLFSLDTTNRKGFRFSALPKAEEFYSCQNDAVCILHDTAISLKLTKYSEDNFGMQSMDDFEYNTLYIEGIVTKPLQISLTRTQYEQLIETTNNIFKVPPDIVPPSSDTTTSQPTENPIDNKKPEISSSGLVPKISFTLPLFIIQLKNENENPLIELSLKEFSFQYERMNTFETSIQILLRSVLMEDLKCSIDSKYRQMVTSISESDQSENRPGGFSSSTSCPDLVRLQSAGDVSTGSLPGYLDSGIESHLQPTARTPLCPETPPPSPQNRIGKDNLVIYSAIIVDENCPALKSQYENLKQRSSIEFNSLNLIISVERWFMFLDFFGLVSESKSKEDVDTTDNKEKESGVPKGNTELDITVRSLNLVFIRNESELAKANVSNASFLVAKEGNLKIVEGKLGSVSLYDLSVYGKIYKEKFLTSGTEALKFVYKKEGDHQKTRSLRKDAELKIQMSSVKYVHTKRFVLEIQAFIREFLQLQTPVMRRIKSDSANIEQRATQLGLEISAGSPIIILPLSYESNQLIVADLGEFSLKNSFHLSSDPFVISKKTESTAPDVILDVMQVNLVNTNLFTGDRLLKNEHSSKYEDASLDMESYFVMKKSKSLFEEKSHLMVQVERNLDSGNNHSCPDISVQGTLSRLQGVVNLEQYKLIRGFLSYNLGENTNDIFVNNSFSLADSRVNLNSTLTIEKLPDKLVWNNMSINLDLEDVAVSLKWNDSPSPSERKSLACINFIKSCLKIDSFTDGSQDIDLVSQEILITDSRFTKTSTNRANVFTKILQPIKSDGNANLVQAEVHSRRRDDHSKYTILLNNMRVMAILDWLENMQEYLLQNAEPPSSHSFKSFDITQNVEAEPIVNNTMEVILNITNSELVFVEKTDVFDTNAVILKSTTVFSYKPSDTIKPMSVNLNPLEVFSCILGYEDETALSIIDPITVNVDLKENKIELQLQKQLCIRLSYHDVKMFTRMMQSLPKQTRTAQKKKSQEEDEREVLISRLISLGFKRSDCIQALDECGDQLDDAAIWLTKSKALASSSTSNNKIMEIHAIAINAFCISLCIIDDCKDADVPLLELSMSQLEFKQELNRQVFSLSGFCAGHLKAIIASDYYNRHLSGWEPVIEPWECLAEWNYSMGHSGNAGSLLNLKIASEKLLKFNLTNTLLDLWSIVKNNWTSDYYGGTSSQVVQSPTSAGFKRRTPFVPFALRNDTGEKLTFKILLTQPGGVTSTETASGNMITDWIEVTPNQIIPFAYGQKSKLRHMDSHKLNLHQILVKIGGWNDVGPVSIDKVGVFFRHARVIDDKLSKARIVFDISLKGSAQKMITVRSALKIINQLDKPVIISLEPYTQNLDAKKNMSATILSSDTYHIPLSWVNSNIYFKPKTDCSLDQENGNVSPIHSKTFTTNMNYQQNEHFGKNYKFTAKPITWFLEKQEEVLQTQQYCRAVNGNKNDSFNLLCVLRREGFPQRDRYPGHSITLIPPLRITNLLCCDLTYESSSNGQSQGRISSSETANIYDVSLESDIVLRISLDNYKKSVPLTVPMGFIGIAEPKLRLIDILDRDLHLRASIHSIKGNGIEIFISAPFWLVNKAGLPLVFRQEGCSKAASGQFEEHETARVVTPLMFSFSDPDASPSLEIRLGDRYGPNPSWCRSLSLYKDIVQRQLKSSNSNENFEIGVEVRRGRGRYSRTSVVTFSPRFQLYNRSSYKLQFAQKCFVGRSTDTIIDAVPGCHFPFHWPRSDLEPLLCVRLADIQNCNWSSGIPIYEAQSLYINIRNDCGEMHFLRLEVLLQGATYFLLFGDAHALPPPIRLDNYSEVPVNFYQEFSRYRTTVKAHSSLSYALDDPMGHQFLQIEAPDGHSYSFALGNLNQAVSLTYSNFIYICFKGTFNSPSISENLYMSTDYYIESQHLVLEVLSDKRVVLARKRAGDRSQLWLMNSNGQLEHEGSSPPIEVGSKANSPRLVLDLERAPNPNDYTNLTVRPPNKQRQHTQAWRFENNRLMCAHSSMCVQARGGIFGLKPGSDAVLGRIESDTRTRTNDSIPIEQFIDRQKFRPGSGHLELTMRMDGPIKTIQIKDVKYSCNDPLPPDPNWKHASSFVLNSNRRSSLLRPVKSSFIDEFYIKLNLAQGLGVSVISRTPCEELAYISLEQISMEVIVTPLVRSIDLHVGDMQIDNQILDTQCPIFLYTMKSPYEEDKQSALVFNAKLLPSPNENAVMFERVILSMKPSILFMEEKFILKTALFFGLGSGHNSASSLADESEYEAQQFTTKILSANAKRYYFEDLQLSSTNIRLSVVTSSKIPQELSDMKKKLGLTLVKFEDAQINIDTFKDKHHFETSEIYLRAIKSHYKSQLKRQAAFILGSVDFLGNPLGFANDLSEGVTDLLLEGSVKSLVKNVTHGISNSTAKLTETISDGLGRVVLSEQDIETRQRILDVPSSNNTSSDHLVAGMKGFGFGLIGGVTSIVKCTYQGAQSEGFPGLLSGFGKGLMGTVTKPIIGVLDLASETANAVREQSKSAHRTLPERKRLPRCVSGAPGGLLPTFSYTQSKGQQYLHIINKRNFTEQLMAYEPKLCNDMRLLVSTEFIRIFSRSEDEIKMVVQYHLRDVVSCHIAQNDFEDGSSSKSSRSRKPIYYIEISSNTDTQVKRPRVKCQSQEMAEKAARHINYAKTIYDEREHTLSYDRSALD